MTSNTPLLWFLGASMALGLAACQGSSDAVQTAAPGAEVVVIVGLQARHALDAAQCMSCLC
jgi:hypothetical protein